MKLQKHLIVLNSLGFQIFNGKLSPGEKLPTEHALTKEMNVDRTSLRVALKQLEFLNVLEIRQGDGIYVKDYRENAGFDFLRMLFELYDTGMLDDKDRASLIDAYMLDEMFEFWVEFLPSVLRLMTDKYSPKDIRTLQHIYNEQLEHFKDKDRLADLDIKALDIIADITDNTLIRLVVNSTRPIRRKMNRLVYTVFDKDAIRADIEMRKSLLNVAYTGTEKDIAEAIDQYKNVLLSYRKQARETWTRHFEKKAI